MLKKESYEEGARYLITESINYVNKKKIKNILGHNTCPICKKNNDQFIHLSNHMHFAFNSICPWCSSRSRHRGLYFLYNNKFKNIKYQIKILHFAPEIVFSQFFNKNKNIIYHTADLNMKEVDYPNLDIQNMDLADCSYDYILCNHVLEHVKNDELALKEINRVLSPNGKAIITIPGDLTRHKTKSFNSVLPNGHFRDYGYDYINILKKYFGNILIINMGRFDSSSKYGIKPNEVALIVTKS